MTKRRRVRWEFFLPTMSELVGNAASSAVPLLGETVALASCDFGPGSVFPGSTVQRAITLRSRRGSCLISMKRLSSSSIAVAGRRGVGNDCSRLPYQISTLARPGHAKKNPANILYLSIFRSPKTDSCSAPRWPTSDGHVQGRQIIHGTAHPTRHVPCLSAYISATESEGPHRAAPRSTPLTVHYEEFHCRSEEPGCPCFGAGPPYYARGRFQVVCELT